MDEHWHEDDAGQLSADDVRDYCAAAPEYVHEQDGFGWTPLMAACSLGRTKIARVLLEAGADPNFVAGDGETPLKLAVPAKGTPFDADLFDALLSAGADPNLGFEPPLRVAIVRRKCDLVEYLVARGADPNRPDFDGETPLWWAAGHGRPAGLEMMRLLVKLGADPTEPGFAGRTLAERLGPAAMREVLRSD